MNKTKEQLKAFIESWEKKMHEAYLESLDRPDELSERYWLGKSRGMFYMLASLRECFFEEE